VVILQDAGTWDSAIENREVADQDAKNFKKKFLYFQQDVYHDDEKRFLGLVVRIK